MQIARAVNQCASATTWRLELGCIAGRDGLATWHEGRLLLGLLRSLSLRGLHSIV